MNVSAWIARIMGGLALICASEAHASLISRAALLQYQYQVDTPACTINLSDGTRIEFAGVYANEGGEVALNELVVFRIASTKAFSFNSIVLVKQYDDVYFGKVVKLTSGQVYIALDARFLERYWGSEDAFSVLEFDHAGGKAVEFFSLPSDSAAARLALSKGKSCHEAAERSD